MGDAHQVPPVMVEAGLPHFWTVSAEDMGPTTAMMYPDLSVMIPYWPSSTPPVPTPPPPSKGNHTKDNEEDGG